MPTKKTTTKPKRKTVAKKAAPKKSLTFPIWIINDYRDVENFHTFNTEKEAIDWIRENRFSIAEYEHETQACIDQLNMVKVNKDGSTEVYSEPDFEFKCSYELVKFQLLKRKKVIM